MPKYVKLYEDFEGPINPRSIIASVNKVAPVEKTADIIENDKVRLLVDLIVLTKELKTYLATKGIVPPDVKKMRSMVERDETSEKYVYILSDNFLDSDKERFGVKVIIDKPLDNGSFILATAIWIEKPSILRNNAVYSEKFVDEFSYDTLSEVIQEAYGKLLKKL